MNPTFILRQFPSIAACSLMAIFSVSAQSTYIWNNSNVSNTANTFDWFTGGLNTQGSWTGGAPLSSNQNTIQFFANTTTPLVHTSSVVQGSNLNNGGTAFQLGTLTLSGLATNSANITLTMNVTGDAFNFSAATGAINLDTIQVGGNGRNITWNVSNAMQLGSASSASTLTLAGNGSSTFNFSGGFTELQAGGGSKLIKSGSSITTLSGAVTLSGGLELNAGTLRLTNAANAITGGITLNGGTLGDNNGTISTATLNNNNITVNGAANLGLASGATTSGGITLNSGANLTLATNNSSATVTGAVTGAGSISIDRLGSGAHTQNLNSTANTFTGSVSFTATSTTTLNVNSLADSASLGAGNIRFVGSAGTSAHTFALGSGAIAPVTLNNRRIEIVSGSAATYTVNNNSSQAFTINTDLLVGATGARALTLGGTGTGLSTFGGKIENGSGTVSISKAGSGTWLFSGDNTYTGTTTVTAGNLITTKAAALPGYDSAAKVIINGGMLGVRVGGSGWSTAQVDTLLTNATKTSGAIGIDTTNGDLTQWAVFTTTNFGAALGLNKLGSNTLTLDQSNTFAGALTISQGTVSINTINNASAAGVLGNSANAVVLGSFGNTGTLLYTGATASSTKTFTAATSGTGVFNVQEAATNLTLGGVISGSGDVTKLGSGILTLGVANSYTGTTNVNGGELRWGVANAIAAGALNINDGGTVNIQGFSDTVGTITIAKGGSISGTTGVLSTGSYISNNGGTMTGATLLLSNNASVTYNSTGLGSTTLQIDKLTVNDSGTNVFNIADGDAAVDFDITGFVNNGGNNVGRAITKTGAGAMQFSGSTLGGAGQNSISLNINEGTVLLNRAANTAFLPGGSALITIGDGIGSADTAILRIASTGGDNQLGNRPITINSEGLFDLNGKTQTGTGALTLNSTGQLQLNNGSLTVGSLTLNPSAGNTTSISLGGTGTLTLGGDVTFNAAGTGRAQITGSALALGGANRIFNVGLGTGADYDLFVGAGISGVRSLTKNGLGRLVLTGSNGYTLGTTVNAGTLQIGDGTTAGTMTSTGALTMGGGTFAVRGPASGGSSQTVASLATTASTGSTIRLTPGASGNTILTVTSTTLSTGAGSSVNFDYTAGSTVGGTVGNNYVVWNPTLTAGIISGAYTVTDSGGTGFATKNGTNIVRLTDPGSSGLPVSTGSATGSYFIRSGYSTVSTITPGSLVQELSGAVAASNVTVNTVGLSSGANLVLGTNLLTLGAGMVFDGPNAYVISGSGAGGLRSSTSGGTINLYNANTSTVTISAPIAANGTSRLTIDGPGTTVLSGTNAYTGATVVNGGTVKFSGTMAASAVTINNNGVAQLGTDTGLNSSNSVTFGANTTGSLQLLGNSATIGALNSNATTLGTPVITNNNVANATLTINSASSSSFGGVIQDGSGGGKLTLAKSGVGALTLSGVNTYSGGTTINAGTVTVTADANLGDASGGITLAGGGLSATGVTTARMVTVNGTGSSIVSAKNGSFSTSGALTGSGTLSLLDPGGSGSTPAYNFNSTSNSFTGAIISNNGVLNVNSLTDSSNNIGFNSTANSASEADIPALRLGTGAIAPLTLNSRAIEFNSAVTSKLYIRNDNTTQAINIGTNLTATGAGAKTLFLNAVDGPRNAFNGNLTNGSGGGSIALSKVGAGDWVLGGSNSYTGGTSVTAGGLTFLQTGSKSASGTHAFSAATTLGLGVNGVSGFTSTDIVNAFAGTMSDNLAGITVTSTTHVGIDTTNGDFTMASGFGATLAKNLVKLGNNTLTLTGTTSYTGVTIAKQGTIQFGTTASMAGGTTGSWTAARFAARSGTTLAFNVGGAGEFTTGNVATLLTNLAASTGTSNGMNAGSNLGFDTTNATGTFTIGNAIADTTGAAGGPRGLTKLGTGTLELTIGNTYTGGTRIGNGILAFANGALGTTGSIAFTGNSTLQWASGNTQDVSSRIVMGNGVNSTFHTNGNDVSFATGIGTTGASLTKAGSGKLTLAASATYTGTTTVSGGTLEIQGSLASSGITNNAALTFNNSSSQSFNGAIDGSGSLTKSGAGTLTLTGTSTYGGATTVSGGMLAITGTGSINSSSGISVASGSHFKYNSSTPLTAPLSLSSGSTLSGSGTIGVDLALTSTSQILAPGNSPGIQNLATTQNWSSFTYEWETNDFLATTAGSAYDQIAITGGLNLTGTTAGSYVLNVFSLTALDVAGDVPNFDEINRSWNILTTTGVINGFDADTWTLNTDGFTSDPAWQGNWSLGLNGSNDALVLSYTVIPEPKAALLGGLGILLLFRRRR